MSPIEFLMGLCALVFVIAIIAIIYEDNKF